MQSDLKQKALALAALEQGITVEYSDVQEMWFFDLPHSVRTAWGESPLEALAAAAEAMGLEPDTAILQQSPSPDVVPVQREVYTAALEHLAYMTEHVLPMGEVRDAVVRDHWRLAVCDPLRHAQQESPSSTGEEGRRS